MLPHPMPALNTLNHDVRVSHACTQHPFHVCVSCPGNIPGSKFVKPFICPMDHVLDIEGGWNPVRAVEQFGPHIEWREYSFLQVRAALVAACGRVWTCMDMDQHGWAWMEMDGHGWFCMHHNGSAHFE